MQPHRGIVKNLMLFDDFGVFFAQGAHKSSINDRFYKGSATGFCSLRESRFSPAISRVFKIAEVHHRMLINIMLFDEFVSSSRQGLQNHQ